MAKYLISFILFMNSSFATQNIKLSDLQVKNQVPVENNALIGSGSEDIFKKMNYTTAALTLASLLTSRENKATHEHKSIGALTGGFFTAQTLFVKPLNKDNFKWSDGLYWLSVPLMMLAPILGGSRAEDIDKGRASSGLVKKHKTIAKIGAWSYLLSVGLWTFDF